MTSTPHITILLDQQPHEVPAGCTLAALLDTLGPAPQAVSTAVNGRFVPRGQRAAHVLQPADAVLLFQPITGG